MANEKVEQTGELKQTAETAEGVKGQVYELHCKMPREMQDYLKGATQLARNSKSDGLQLLDTALHTGQSL